MLKPLEGLADRWRGSWTVAVLLGVGALAPAWGQAAESVMPTVSLQDRAKFADAYTAFRGGDIARARRMLDGRDTALSAKVLDWLYFSSPSAAAPFGELSSFITTNQDWPRLNAIRRNAELALDNLGEESDALVIDWLTRYSPLSAVGKARLGEAKLRGGDREEGVRLLREAWINGDLNEKRERDLWKRHRRLLSKEDHELRLTRLLWDRDRPSAQRMLGYVDEPTKAFGKAWLALMGAGGNPDALLARVPAELRDHPGLSIERARWRRQKGDDERARALLLSPPNDEVRPIAWWGERRIQARRAVAAGHISDGYNIARMNDLSEGPEYAEAEWLAGWIALRFLSDPTLAGLHFARMHQAVVYPVSLARAGYWAGRAMDALGDQRSARVWYEDAAKHSLTYYGQLAIQKLDRSGSYALPPDPEPDDDDRMLFRGHELARAALLLAEAGSNKAIDPFINRLAVNSPTPGVAALALALAERVGRRDLAVAAAKKAAQKGTYVPSRAYPVIDMPREYVSEVALLLSVARQESQFNPDAVSPAGARGLMQLMPATAHKTAKSINLPYSADRLTSDPRYNSVLGSAHMAELLKAYNGSYVLAVAAYNAGEGRVRKWIKENGDPRWDEVDEVDWVEQIPFEETRNYVQRVMEGVQIYRERLTGRPSPLRLSQDLKR
ncbi:MAG: lytic transglycosylase domain-containing protein [Alphaproteobacteria bacterium]|nr:lytic transglycosylase domain-containing protein [Alphaproteobacteria bacterium]